MSIDLQILYTLIILSLALSVLAIILNISRTQVLSSKVSKLENLVKSLFSRKERSIKKIRKRYIVFSIISKHRYKRIEVEEAIRRAFSEMFGEISAAKADPQLIYFDPSIQRGVIRVSHIYKDHVIALLGFIREINGRSCLLIPIKTTGTIRKARKILYTLGKK